MGAKDAVLERVLASAADFSDEQIAQTVDLLVANGAAHEASDVHIEPQSQRAVVRFRVDGALQTMHKLPLAALAPIAAHLKGLAGLPTDETNLPLQGNFEMTANGRTLRVALSTMPVVGGEHIVLHLASRDETVPSVEMLGLWGHSLATVRTALTRPRGLILVAGPKRAGTETTLLSLASMLSRPSVSIISLEESVGARLPGVIQTEVHGPVVRALQAALHHDPNAIAVSNLPDQASVELTVQSAVAGHLMLAGLHAGTAAKALLHVRAAGVTPFALGSALLVAMAQARVPRLCEACRVRHELTPVERAALEQTFGITGASARARVHELERQAVAADLGAGLPLGSTPTGITHTWRAREGGCEACHHRGVRGQLNLIEVFAATDRLRAALAQDDVSDAGLQAAAVRDGAVALGLDGLIKALRGLTTVESIAPLV